MKTFTPLVLSGLLIPGFLAAQVVAPAPNPQRPLPPQTEVRIAEPVETEVRIAPQPGETQVRIATEPATAADITAETRAILQDAQQRDRTADIEAALQLKDEAEAQLLIDSILAKAQSDAILSAENARSRQRLAEANRTAEAREESVTYLSNRLRGEVVVTEAPESFRSRTVVEAPAAGAQVVRATEPLYYDNNRRVVTYRTMNEIPPVLLASSRLNRVQVQQITDTPYATALSQVENRPVEYIAPEAYSVSYAVDPNSVVTRDDILFVQGSTAFLDAYSYDLVQDLAMAISDPALAAESFVIEGHASMEGDYHENLALSQARAERIAREIVNFGVAPARLVPVGYGESEATQPAEAAEQLRALDRRVAVYRLQPATAVAP